MFARIFIIINHKGTKFKQAFRMFSRVLGNAEGKVDRKRAAFSFFTLDIDASAHQIDQVMGNGKTKTGTPEMLSNLCGFLFEWQEYAAQEVFLHADTVITDNAAQMNMLRTCLLFRELHCDLASARREFNGISYDVNKHLINAQLVADQAFLIDVVGNDFEADAFFFCLRLNQVVDAVDGFLKIEFFIRKCKLIALNFGHVQDVIDEAQQVTGGEKRFLQAVFNFLFVANSR